MSLPKNEFSFEQIILIPIGGIGNRFQLNNYEDPKALVKVFGESILVHLINNLNINKETLVCITHHKMYEKYRLEDAFRKEFPEINFFFKCLSESTRGAAETINLTLKSLPLDYDLPIICLDSDNFYTENIIKKWNHKNKIFYFQDSSSSCAYSYILKDKNYRVLDLQEKNRVSDFACCGAYGFASYQQLLSYTQIVLDKNLKSNNEFYTSVCIKLMIDDEIPFTASLVGKNNYHPLGTPLLLRQFCNNYPKVSSIDGTINMKVLKFCFDLDNTLVSYPKVPNDYSTVLPIQKNINFLKYLKSFGHTIIIHTARRMKTHKSNLGAVTADIGKVTFETLDKFDIPYDEIYFGKPHADFYIDDNAISAFSNLEKKTGFYQDSIKPRDFNVLEKSSFEIYTKKSADLSGEIYFYSNIPSQVKDMFPLFIDYDVNNTWYSIEKTGGLTISNLYVSELLKPNNLRAVMESIMRLQKIAPNNSAINIYQNYKTKLKERYESYDYTRFDNSAQVYDVIHKQLDFYESKNLGKISCIHGDPVFSNILINENHKIKFIDMRGKLGDTLTIYGDYLYDWAKIYQSLLGYDEILLNKFVNADYKNAMLNEFKEIFLSWFSEEDFNHLKVITNSFLFSLIPLHDNENCIHYYNLIKLEQ